MALHLSESEVAICCHTHTLSMLGAKVPSVVQMWNSIIMAGLCLTYMVSHPELRVLLKCGIWLIRTSNLSISCWTTIQYLVPGTNGTACTIPNKEAGSNQFVFFVLFRWDPCSWSLSMNNSMSSTFICPQKAKRNEADQKHHPSHRALGATADSTLSNRKRTRNRKRFDEAIGPNAERVCDVRSTDVIFGRGKCYQEHPGNRRMRAIVRQYKEQYKHASTKSEKKEIHNKVAGFT